MKAGAFGGCFKWQHPKTPQFQIAMEIFKSFLNWNVRLPTISLNTIVTLPSSAIMSCLMKIGAEKSVICQRIHLMFLKQSRFCRVRPVSLTGNSSWSSAVRKKGVLCFNVNFPTTYFSLWCRSISASSGEIPPKHWTVSAVLKIHRLLYGQPVYCQPYGVIKSSDMAQTAADISEKFLL